MENGKSWKKGFLTSNTNRIFLVQIILNENQLQYMQFPTEPTEPIFKKKGVGHAFPTFLWIESSFHLLKMEIFMLDISDYQCDPQKAP